MGRGKKAADKDAGGEKKKDAGSAAAGPQPIVLKVELHCAGCASKVRKAIKRAPGVESVAADVAAGKVVVTGPADAAELKDRVESRTKKPVQIVSAGAGQPKKDKKADKEKGDDGGEKKAEKENGGDKKEEKQPKEPKEETVTLKIQLHCEGCIDRVKRRISKIKGVKDVVIDAAKDLVKVTGTMDAAALLAYLRDKLSRPVEVVAPNKKDKGDKKRDGGGDEKKKDKSAAYVAPEPLADAGMYQMPPHLGYVPYDPSHGGYYGAPPPPNPSAFYHHPAAFGAQYPPPPAYPYAAHVYAPQMFSDENPNACSVM